MRLPFAGSLTSPQFDFGKAIQATVLGGGKGGDPLANIGGLLQGLDSATHHKRDKSKDHSNPPDSSNATGNPESTSPKALDIFRDLTGGGKNQPKENPQNSPKEIPHDNAPKTGNPPDASPNDTQAKPKDPAQDLIDLFGHAKEKKDDHKKQKPTSKPATKPGADHLSKDPQRCKPVNKSGD